MSIIEQLNQKLADLKVTVEELPEDAQDELKELRKILANRLPSLRDKDGKFKPEFQRKIKRLAQGIIREATIYAEARDSKKPTVTPGDPNKQTPPVGDPNKQTPPSGDPNKQTPPSGDPNKQTPPVGKKKSSWFDLLD